MNREQAKQREKNRAYMKTSPFVAGDRVWCRYPELKTEAYHKFEMNFFGPYKLVSITREGVAEIRPCDNEAVIPFTVNVERLRKCSMQIPNLMREQGALETRHLKKSK